MWKINKNLIKKGIDYHELYCFDLKTDTSKLITDEKANVVKIDFDDMSEAIPAFLCIIAMPFTYSISEGISVGVISYVLINLLTGKFKEKKISIVIYILAVLFILKYMQ